MADLLKKIEKVKEFDREWQELPVTHLAKEAAYHNFEMVATDLIPDLIADWEKQRGLLKIIKISAQRIINNPLPTLTWSHTSECLSIIGNINQVFDLSRCEIAEHLEGKEMAEISIKILLDNLKALESENKRLRGLLGTTKDLIIGELAITELYIPFDAPEYATEKQVRDDLSKLKTDIDQALSGDSSAVEGE